MTTKLVDALGKELKARTCNLELPPHRPVLVRPASPELEKNYMRLVLADIQKEHPIKAYFIKIYYRLRKKI